MRYLKAIRWPLILCLCFTLLRDWWKWQQILQLWRGSSPTMKPCISGKITWDMWGTSFSSSLILLAFCLDLSFSRSISKDSSLFFLDNSTILVAAASPAKPDVPEQKNRWVIRKLFWFLHCLIHIPARTSRSSSRFLFRCLISKSFSLTSLKRRLFSSLSSLSWSCKCSFSTLQYKRNIND